MVVSAAKLEANRRNAERSTGPRSQEGKSRSRLNALTHGMTAESAIVPGEDSAEFEARLRTCSTTCSPAISSRLRRSSGSPATPGCQTAPIAASLPG